MTRGFRLFQSIAQQRQGGCVSNEAQGLNSPLPDARLGIRQCTFYSGHTGVVTGKPEEVTGHPFLVRGASGEQFLHVPDGHGGVLQQCVQERLPGRGGIQR